MDPAQWMWGLSLLSNCIAKRYEINKARMVRIAEYSRDTLRELRADTGIAYDERAQGTLQLFRRQEQLDGVGADVEVLKRFGVPFELLDRDGCVGVEPALGLVKDKVAGGTGTVRVGHGRDYGDVAPLRGTYSGGASDMFVTVEMTQLG